MAHDHGLSQPEPLHAHLGWLAPVKEPKEPRERADRQPDVATPYQAGTHPAADQLARPTIYVATHTRLAPARPPSDATDLEH